MQCSINLGTKAPRIKPGAAGCKARTLSTVLCGLPKEQVKILYLNKVYNALNTYRVDKLGKTNIISTIYIHFSKSTVSNQYSSVIKKTDLRHVNQ